MLPIPLAVFKGPTSKERGRVGEGKRRVGEGRGELAFQLGSLDLPVLFSIRF